MCSAGGKLHAVRDKWAACFDARGERQYKVQLPLDSTESIGLDGGGRLYARGYLDRGDRPRVIVRVGADGSLVETIARDRREGGTVGREELLRVAGDGTLYLFGYNGAVRVLEADGRVRTMTDRSREWEREEDAQRARNA